MPDLKQIYTETTRLSAPDKLRLVEWVLGDLDKPDPEIEQLWKTESEKRWAAYQAGLLKTRSYAEVMAKYQRP